MRFLVVIMHSSTKQTPFFSNYGHYPQTDPFQIKDVESPIAEDLTTCLVVIHDKFAFQLYEAQDRYKGDCKKGRPKSVVHC